MNSSDFVSKHITEEINTYIEFRSLDIIKGCWKTQKHVESYCQHWKSYAGKLKELQLFYYISKTKQWQPLVYTSHAQES